VDSSTASGFPEPPQDAIELGFGSRNTAVLRRVVTAQGQVAGFNSRRVEDMISAVNELTSNSIRHGGGQGVLKTWRDGVDLVFEVSGAGRIGNPEQAGRVKPQTGQIGGYGLWLVNQLSDEMHVRDGAEGSAVRIWFRLEG
jgi:anti-sigma regulatory factor (Ser/Thr protein kinase)